MIRSVVALVLAVSVGVGSTLLVQTVILPPPVVVACPEPETPTEEEVQALQKALEPLGRMYVPQGRLLPMPGTGSKEKW
jgi:hypothetical protein